MKLRQFLHHIQYSAQRPDEVSEGRWIAMQLWYVNKTKAGLSPAEILEYCTRWQYLDY